MATLVLVRAELVAVALPSTVADPRLSLPVLMQGHCLKVLKVSEQSTSVEKSVEALDNGAALVLPAGAKAASNPKAERSSVAGNIRIGGFGR